MRFLVPLLVVAILLGRSPLPAQGQDDYSEDLNGIVEDFLAGLSSDVGMGDYSAEEVNCNPRGVIAQVQSCNKDVAMGQGDCPSQCKKLIKQLEDNCPDLLDLLDSSIINDCSGGGGDDNEPTSSPPSTPGQVVIDIDYDYDDSPSSSPSPSRSPSPDNSDNDNDNEDDNNNGNNSDNNDNNNDNTPSTPTPVPDSPTSNLVSPSPSSSLSSVVPIPIPSSPSPFPLATSPPTIPFVSAPSPAQLILPSALPPLEQLPLVPILQTPPTVGEPELVLPDEDCYNYVMANEGNLSSCGSLISAGVPECPGECETFYNGIPVQCVTSINENAATLAVMYKVPANITEPTNNPCAAILSAGSLTAVPVLLIATVAVLASAFFM